MDPQFQEVVQEINKSLDERFVGLEERLKNQAKMNMEELKTDVKWAAEGYGATLEGIERRLDDLNKKMDAKLADHDGILDVHNKRITALETRQR